MKWGERLYRRVWVPNGQSRLRAVWTREACHSGLVVRAEVVPRYPRWHHQPSRVRYCEAAPHTHHVDRRVTVSPNS